MDSFDVMAAEEIGHGDYLNESYQLGNLYKFRDKILHCVNGNGVSHCDGCVFIWRDKNRVEDCSKVGHRRNCQTDMILVEMRNV